MDAMEQLEELVVLAKKLVDHDMNVVVDPHEHSITSRHFASAFMEKATMFGVNFPMLEDSCRYRRKRSEGQ